MRALGILVVLAFACGDDSSVVDAATDVPGRDAPGEDASLDVPGTDTRGVDAPGTDSGPPPGPLAWEDCEGGGRMLDAGPDDYRDVLPTLEPGDTLQLAAGDYARGLPISVSGEEGACIVIEGPTSGARPRILGSDSFNLIAFRGASWVKVRHLDLDGMGMAGFGVASQDADVPVHHIVIEDLDMQGFDANQQITGISTKTPAWDWVIRGNVIRSAGTGMYLGNSDGRQPFIGGLIERNFVLNTIGYNMQIKHQVAEGREDLGIAEMPSEATTIIRHNVFVKADDGSSGGDARPNVLVGHFPNRGSGMNDQRLFYGNFFYENPNENLFQGEGNLAMYDNVFVSTTGGGINIQPHNDVPKEVHVFHNTVVTAGRGISITGADGAFSQTARWNVSCAGMPIRNDDVTEANVELDAACSVLRNAAGAPDGDLDLRPNDAASVMVGVDEGFLDGFLDATRDFDGFPRTGSSAGAYVPDQDGPALSITP